MNLIEIPPHLVSFTLSEDQEGMYNSLSHFICSHIHSCSEEDEDEEEYLDNAAAAEAVKSSRAKYIEEEQEVLANINLVKAMKQKFAR